MARKVAKKHPSTLHYEELEQRVLFSADALPGLDSVADDEQTPVEAVTCDIQVERETAPEAAEQMAAEARWELVFINDNVADSEQLIAGLQQGDDHRMLDVVTLDSGRDGLDQVSEVLAERQDLAAVHFISHGSDGQINLGDSWLNGTTLQQNSAAVAGWGDALTEDGDMLFYGCNIAEGSDGQSLLDDMAVLTGADVTASDDLTGSSEQGGDWDLEYVSGTIETEMPVRSTLQEGWSHLLASPTITSDGGGATAAINVVENTSAVTTATATDADTGDTLTYSIDPTSSDAATFNIDSTTGELNFATASDFEAPADVGADNVYDVTVQVDDGNGGTDSQAISVTVTDVAGDVPPAITMPGPALRYTESDPATPIDPAATVVDLDSADFKNGTLTVSFSAGGTVDDELSIIEDGGVTVLVNNIFVGGQYIGRFSGGTGGTQLVIDWGPQASSADAQAVLRQIAYHNTSDSPSTTPRTIDFVLTDGDGGTSNTARQTVNVSSVNDDPLVAANDELNLAQGTTALIPNSLLHVTDADNTTAEVTCTLTVSPTNGTLKLNGIALGVSDTFTQEDIDAELLTYEHGDADTSPDSFTFTAADGVGGTLGATLFDITIVTDPPGNDAPVLTMPGPALNYTENDPATPIDPSATVVDVDSTDFKDGTLTVSFSAGGTINDQLSIVVDGVVTLNDDDRVFVNGKNVGSFSGGADGTPLVIDLSPQATPAAAQAVLHQIGYFNTSETPSTTPRTIDFVLTDGDGGTSNTAQQTVNVTPANDAPTTSSVTLAAISEESGARLITEAELLTNASDAEGDAVTASNLTISAGYGSLVDNGDGTWSYTPAADDDTSVSFIYTISDGINSGVGSATMDITPVNDAPVAVDDAVSGNEDSAITGNVLTTDGDVDGDSLSVNTTPVIDTGNGSLVLNADGTFTYTPAADFNGTDTFTYEVSDGNGGIAQAVVTIDVAPVNDAPVAADATINATEDTIFNGTLPASADIDGDPVGYALNTDAANSTVVVNVNGSFSYTPDLNTNGVDNFTYTVSDGNGGTNSYTVTVNVAPVNDAPIFTSAAGTAATEGRAFSYTITTSDVDGDTPTITAPTLPAWLTLSDNGDGTATLSGMPTNADIGNHMISLQVQDGAATAMQNFNAGVLEVAVVPPDDNNEGTSPVPPPILEDSLPNEVISEEDVGGENLLLEESVLSAEEPLTIGASNEADQTLPSINGQDTEQTDDILYLTDENDNDQLSERPEDESGYIYLDNEIYKEIAAGEYLSFNYKATENVPDLNDLPDFDNVDFENNDLDQVVENGNYDLLREEIDEAFSSERESQTINARIATVTATTFTVGIVGYLLRAGSLVAGFMATLPLWRSFDPIVIYSKNKKDKSGQDEPPDSDEQQSDTFFEG